MLGVQRWERDLCNGLLSYDQMDFRVDIQCLGRSEYNTVEFTQSLR